MKRLTSLIIALCMVLLAFAPSANALTKSDVWDGEIADSFESGDGSLHSPFVIHKASQLALLAHLVNTGEGDYDSLHYKVGMPIYLNGASASNTWTPIGTLDHPFRGYFHGCEYEISKAYIISPTSSYLGLFGVVEDAEILYVNMKDAYIVGDEYIGSVVGLATNSKIENCRFQGEICGTSCVSGIAGAAYSSTISKCETSTSSKVFGSEAHTGGIVGDSSSAINQCTNFASIQGNDYTGGIVGFNLFGGEVKLSYNKGNVVGKNSIGGIAGYNLANIIHSTNEALVDGESNLGGICGQNTLSGLVSNCENKAEITTTFPTQTNIGGIVGNNILGTIEHSINNGDVIKGNSSGNVGGIAGQSFDGRISESANYSYIICYSNGSNVGGIVGRTAHDTIEKSHNTGSISSDASTTNSKVGGIAGESISTISNSYNSGEINGGRYLGGITGENNGTIENSYNAGKLDELIGAGSITGLNDSEGFIDNCYYLDTTISFSLSNFGTELTDSQMQNQDSFYGLDFPAIWTMSTGEYLYPILNILVSEVEILQEKDHLQVGQSTQLQAIVTPITAINQEVVWSVSSDAASINQTGLLVAMRVGFVKAKAQCGDTFDEVNFDIYQFYKVSFYDGYTNELISQVQVLHGTIVTNFPEVPTHEHQTFIGWDYDGEPIYADTIITAMYEITKYNVSFVDGITGLEFHSVSVDAGTIISDFPDAPVHEHYKFIEWNYDGEQIYADTVIVANYDINQYQVSFVDGFTSGEISNVSVDAGTIISNFPDTPVHENQQFVGWDYNDQPIYANTVITAMYEIIKYKVSFVDGVTGLEIHSITVEVGTVVSDYPAAPEHDGYVFSHWDYSEEPIASDTVITAVYNEIPYYTVTFIDGVTNDLLGTALIMENAIVTDFPQVPVHDGFVFSHWEYDGEPITQDITIVAIYATSTYHSVKFIDGVTGEEISDILVENGKKITEFPTPPEHIGYEFDKWDYDFKPIESDTIVTALYKETFILGDVNADGSINSGDAVLILRFATGSAQFNELQRLSGDFNRDGNVNTGDATSILKALVS